MKSGATKHATFQYSDDRILYITLMEDAEIEIADSKEMQKVSLELTGGEKFVAFIDGRAKINVSKEAREWGSTAEAQQNMIAQAIWINSIANKLVGNFIIQFHKPVAKTRLFSDPDEALVWLKEQLKIHDQKK